MGGEGAAGLGSSGRGGAEIQGHHPVEAWFAQGPEPAGTGLHHRRAKPGWLADITGVGTDQGWLYLAVILDVYSHAAVGWAMAERITRHLFIAALAMAVWRRPPAPGLIAHLGRGSQYAAGNYQAALALHGSLCNMSRK